MTTAELLAELDTRLRSRQQVVTFGYHPHQHSDAQASSAPESARKATGPSAAIPDVPLEEGVLGFDCNWASQSEYQNAINEIEQLVPYGLAQPVDVVFVDKAHRVWMKVCVRFAERSQAVQINQAVLNVLRKRGLY